MDKDFLNSDFEQLLRERTEEFKMYPSESVWSNIFNKLHPGRRWGIIGGSLLFLLFTASVLVLRTNNHNNNTTIPNESSASSNDKVAVNQNNSIGETHQKNDFIRESAGDQLTQEVNHNPAIGIFNHENSLNNDPRVNLNTTAGDEKWSNTTLAKSLQLTLNDGYTGYLTSDANPIAGLTGLSQIDFKNQDITKTSAAGKSPVINPAYVYLDAGRKTNKLATSKTSKKSPFEWQLYFAPSVSYRALYNNENAASLAFAYTNYIPGDIDKAVHHTPALGFELGNAVLYSLTDAIKIKAGLQLNYSRYNIKAYSSYPEIATVRLRGDYNQTEELRIASNYKNYGVFYQSTTIASQSVAISLPLGVDLKMMGNKNMGWYVSGSFQPTYILNNKAYLITNDLKNYVQNSELFRRFTMNSNIETFLRLERSNGVALQVGPQLRYQINSSYTKKYPISEHLIEYGLKVGVTKRF